MHGVSSTGVYGSKLSPEVFNRDSLGVWPQYIPSFLSGFPDVSSPFIGNHPFHSSPPNAIADFAFSESGRSKNSRESLSRRV